MVRSSVTWPLLPVAQIVLAYSKRTDLVWILDFGREASCKNGKGYKTSRTSWSFKTCRNDFRYDFQINRLCVGCWPSICMLFCTNVVLEKTDGWKIRARSSIISFWTFYDKKEILKKSIRNGKKPTSAKRRAQYVSVAVLIIRNFFRTSCVADVSREFTKKIKRTAKVIFCLNPLSLRASYLHPFRHTWSPILCLYRPFDIEVIIYVRFRRR